MWEHCPRLVDGGLIEVVGLPYWESRVKPSRLTCCKRAAHEGPLVHETSERHLGYQIRGNYHASMTGMLFHSYTVGGRRPELVNCICLSGKDAFLFGGPFG